MQEAAQTLVYHLYIPGANTDPCDMPLVTLLQLEEVCLITGLISLFSKQSLIQLKRVPLIPLVCSIKNVCVFM